MEDVIHQFGEGTRLGVASNSYVSEVDTRRLGWSPKAASLVQWWVRSLTQGAA